MLAGVGVAVNAAVPAGATQAYREAFAEPPDWTETSIWRMRVAGVNWPSTGPGGVPAFSISEANNTVRGAAKGFGDLIGQPEGGANVGPNLAGDTVTFAFMVNFITLGGEAGTATTEIALGAVPYPERESQQWSGTNAGLGAWQGGEVFDMILRLYQGSQLDARYPGHLFLHAGVAGMNNGGDIDRRNEENWDLGVRIDPAAHPGLYYYPAGMAAFDIWYNVVMSLDFVANVANVSLTNMFNNYTFTTTLPIDESHDRVDIFGMFFRRSAGEQNTISVADVRAYVGGAAGAVEQAPVEQAPVDTTAPADVDAEGDKEGENGGVVAPPTAPPAAPPTAPPNVPTGDGMNIAIAVALGGLLLAAVTVALVLKKRQQA
jgi:hypothetical protein